MRREQRETIADWLIVLGALALFGSLFLTWSRQFSPAFLERFGTADQLAGVPHTPTAWQVYSSMDIVLAVLAVALVSVALAGGRPARVCALFAAVVGLVFVVHAVGTPPTTGANVFNPSLSVPNLAPSSPAAGTGETVAIVGLGVAMVGLAVSFTAD